MSPRAEDHLPLHPLEFRILLVLLDGASYGTRIVQAIEERETGRTLYPANLYRRIRSLMSDGLLEEAPSPERADPRRTYLRITEPGRAVAAAEARRLRELVAEAASHELIPEAASHERISQAGPISDADSERGS
jgi:DNA-binding PadR family transcriptional regulator